MYAMRAGAAFPALEVALLHVLMAVPALMRMAAIEIILLLRRLPL